MQLVQCNVVVVLVLVLVVVQRGVIECSVVKLGGVQCSVISVAQCSVIQCSCSCSCRCSVVQCSVIECSVVECSVLKCNVISVVQRSVVAVVVAVVVVVVAVIVVVVAVQCNIVQWWLQLKLLQNPHVFLIFGKVQNPLRLPRKTTSERPSVFSTFGFEMCFAPHQRSLFRHLNFQKSSKHEVFCTF